MCKYSEKQPCSTGACSQASSCDSLRGDTQLSGFGQKELNESTTWVRGSLKSSQIRGLKLVFCIRFRYKGKCSHQKQGRRCSYSLLSQLLSVVIFQSAHSSLQFDIICRCIKSLSAFRSQIDILTSWGSRAVFCITQVDILSSWTISDWYLIILNIFSLFCTCLKMLM